MATGVSVVMSVSLEDTTNMTKEGVQRPALKSKCNHDIDQVSVSRTTSTTGDLVSLSDVVVERSQQHAELQHQHLLIDNTQTPQQVEQTLAELVSGVVAQTPPPQQEPLLEQTTASPAIPTSSSSSTHNIPNVNPPWMWHFAIAGVAASEDGEPTSQNPYVGFVHTVEDAYEVMRSYEVHTTSKFVQVRTVQDFGKDLDCLKYKHRVRFEERKPKDDMSTNRLPLKDTPFLLLGTKWFECQHGRDYHVNFKRKRMQAIEVGDIVVKRRNKAAKSKKVGCQAKVWMKDVLVFPKKKLRKDVKSAKKMLSKEIRTGTVKGERRIYVFLPDASLHTNHIVGEACGTVQRVDPQVIDQIYWLVHQGIHTTQDVQLHLDQYVKENLFQFQTPPSQTNRRFYPTKKDIRNHMIAARKGRLPPKDRAEIAKQSSTAARMCAANKLAYPKTNQTTKCRSLSKQIMTLSKRIKNPSILAEATKKMEDLVAFLRAGAQKEQVVQRMEKRACEPSVLQSVSLERPPRRKRQRGRCSSDEKSRLVKMVKQDNTKSDLIIPVLSVDGKVASEAGSSAGDGLYQQQTQQNKGCSKNQQVETSRVDQSQVEISDQGQNKSIEFQPQTQDLVDVSIPLSSASIPVQIYNGCLPLQNKEQTSQIHPSSAQGNGQTLPELQKFLQKLSASPQVTIIPQNQFQSMVGSSDVIVQDFRLEYTTGRTSINIGSEDSSAARALIQLDGLRSNDLQQGDSFLTSPLQFHASSSVIPSNNSVLYTSPTVPYPATTTS